MSEFSGPWFGHNDFSEQQWRDFYQNMFSTGVVKGARVAGSLGGDLAVTNPSGLQMQAATGIAVTKGFLYYTDAAVTKTLAAADPSNPRIDTLIISWSFSGRTAAIAVKQGTPAASPVAPTLTQNDTTYELPLCDARVNAGATTIATLTDRRAYSAAVGAVNKTGDVMTGPLTINSFLGVNRHLGGVNTPQIFVAPDDAPKQWEMYMDSANGDLVWLQTTDSTEVLRMKVGGSINAGGKNVPVTGAGNQATTPLQFIVVGPTSAALPAAGVKGRIAFVVPFSLP